MSQTNMTWKFWAQFVVKDCLAYISLYIGIRTGNCDLRNASVKLMAPIFSAFDHFTYKKIIAQNLADIITLPKYILHSLQQGRFSVSLSGRPGHSVAIDEAHEMAINKHIKTSIVRPSPEYINRVVNYLPHRAKSLQNLDTQLFPEKEKKTSESSILTTKLPPQKIARNIQEQKKAIGALDLLATTENTGLKNPLCKRNPSPEQTHDLLKFPEIGQEEFDKYIEYNITGKASVNPTQRKRKLCTLADKKVNKRRMTQLQKDIKLVQKCLHKKLLWSKVSQKPVTSVSEQFITLPLAPCDNEGLPLKGQKSFATTIFEKRYEKAIPQVVLNALPSGWIPECCILEGMFMLNTSPEHIKHFLTMVISCLLDL